MKKSRKDTDNRVILKNQGGFTLIELMVVIVILGILAGMIVPRIMDRPEEARRTKAEIDIGAISQALKMYKVDNGNYPSMDQGLRALIELPQTGQLAKNWKGPYLDKGSVPKDPWENEYIYINPGMHGSDFDLMSYGADGELGGEDTNADINSWEL